MNWMIIVLALCFIMSLLALFIARKAGQKIFKLTEVVKRNNERIVRLGSLQDKTIELMKKYDYYIMNHRQRRNYDREAKKHSKRKPNDNKPKPS